VTRRPPTPPERKRCDLCRRYGPHLCAPRADRAEAVFTEILVHTKGRWARRPFLLADWQRDGIVRPMFGRVRYDPDLGRWIRRYRLCWIELARKNGKSELLAGIALILLCADDEEGAEIYGAAVDRDQARKVFDVAQRMVQLSPVLSRRLTLLPHAKRIVDERTGSFYEAVAADAAGNLGHNPSGIIFDEVLTQKSGDLWHALRTGMGAREQPLMVAATTAGNDPESFAAAQHAEMAKVAEDPERAPHTLVYMRNTDPAADPWDETVWAHGNPALGDFLSVQALRDEALEARNDPALENSFRQYRLNQWVQQTTRSIPLHLWDACADESLGSPDEVWARLTGRRCFGGLDLSATTDLTSVCWVFPDDPYAVAWRFWIPETQIAHLDKYLGGRAAVWVRQGWLTATEGNVIDYEQVYADITRDAGRFRVVDISHDRWQAEPVRQELERRGLTSFPVGQGYVGMGPPMAEFKRLLKGGQLTHFGNPVARWHADSLETKTDDAENEKPVKPARDRSGRRIDGMVALLMGIDGAMRRGAEPEDDGLPMAGGF
jgi:phage terminase large subunit-like protein